MRARRLFYGTYYDLSMTPYGDILLPMLAGDGWEITVAAPNASRSLLRTIWPYQCRSIDLPAKTISRDAKLIAEVLKARAQRYDLVYIHSQRAVSAWPALLGSRRAVYHNADYYDPLRYRWHCILEKRMARRAVLNINNEFHRGYIMRAQYGLRNRILTVPPNLPLAWPVARRDPELRARMAGGDPSAFVLMLHGGYSGLRMTDELLQALAALPNRYRLVMTGSSDESSVQQRLENLGLTGRVLRLPRLGYTAMLGHTVNADAGVLLYSNNDLGNFFTAPGRMTEYLACGIPVLACDHTGLENLVLKYRLGVTVNAQVPAAISDGILELCKLITEGAIPGGHCRDEFVRRFAVDHWRSAVCDAFTAACAGNGGKAAPPAWPWLPGGRRADES